jgi:hypothetical protein
MHCRLDQLTVLTGDTRCHIRKVRSETLAMGIDLLKRTGYRIDDAEAPPKERQKVVASSNTMVICDNLPEPGSTACHNPDSSRGNTVI